MLFPSYEVANAWYRESVKAGVSVPKPALADVIRLVHGAGGWTSLAHPGYYDRAGAPLADRVSALKAIGLDGIELDYPYHACSPHLYSPEAESTFVASLRSAGEAAGLRFTRGSDCHTAQDFVKVYGPAPA